MKRLIEEIHSRSLWQVLGIYLVGSWIALQVVDVLANNFGLPEWFPAFALALLVIGLPIVLATAFVQEGIRPEPRRAVDAGQGSEDPTSASSALSGVEAPEAAGAGKARSLFTWRNAIGGGVLAFALLGVVTAGRMLTVPGTAGLSADRSDAGDTRSVAVLPFTNMNQDPESQFFSDGVHEDILAHLAKVEDLKVISRTSVMEYRDRAVNLRTVADELGVATILEGSVRRSEDRVRVVAQLIDAETDEHLWADTYDRTVTDIFEIQTDIARSIAAALQASFAPTVAVAAGAPPTENFEAYEHYLQGSQHLHLADFRLDAASALLAIEELERAVALDPGFAMAYARLARARISAERFELMEQAPLIEAGRDAARRALELGPDLAEAHHAMWVAGADPGNSLRYLERALELEPGNAAILRDLGVELRARDRWEEAYAAAVRAAALDPRSAANNRTAGQTARYMRRFDEAQSYLDRAVRLATDATGLSQIYNELILLEVARGGGIDGAKRVFREERERYDVAPATIQFRFINSPEVLVGGEWDTYIDSLDPESDDPAVACISDPILVGTGCHYQKGMMHRLAGRTDRARAYWDSLVADRAELRPEFATPEAEAGWLALQARDLARAGLFDEASSTMDEVMAMDVDAFDQLTILRRRAQFYAEMGDAERAVEDLERLLAVPSQVTYYTLRDRQAWLPIRDDPAFQALLARHQPSP
jgi:TolB-like protein